MTTLSESLRDELETAITDRISSLETGKADETIPADVDEGAPHTAEEVRAAYENALRDARRAGQAIGMSDEAL